MKEYSDGSVKYLVRYPEGFAEDRKYPVIMFLHGSGTRAQEFTKLRKGPLFAAIEKYKDFPFIIVAPLCTENTWFDLWDGIKQLVRDVAALPYVDETRFYLMGSSMGGYATWQLAMSMPEYFAAIVPICGGGMYWNAGRLIDVPVWAFHGALDKTVLLEESEKMVNKVNEKGGNAKLTIYPENYHNAWSDTFANYEVFSWLLQHQKTVSRQLEDSFTDAVKFG